MTEQLKDQFNQKPINLVLNYDAAIDLQLIRIDGKDSASCILTGSKNTRVLNLSLGKYTLLLRPLSDIPLDPYIDIIEINDTTEIIDITDIFERHKKGNTDANIPPRISELNEAYRISQQSQIKKKQIKLSPLKKVRAYLLKDVRAFTSAAKELTDTFIYSMLALNNPMSPTQLMEAINFGRAQRDALLVIPCSVSLSKENDPAPWAKSNINEFPLEIETFYSESTISIVIKEGYSHQYTSHRRYSITLEIYGKPAIRVPLPLFSGGVRVSIFPFKIDGNQDVFIRLEAIEARKQALVAALTGNFTKQEALSVLNWSTNGKTFNFSKFLAEEEKDLWAATVAALLLARTYQVSAEITEWFFELARIAPNISDASVAAAWAMAKKDMPLKHIERGILDYLISSRKIGAPFLRTTYSMALELLNALQGSASSSEVRQSANNEICYWSNRASRRIFDSPYIMWEQDLNKLQKEILPNNRYKVLFSGKLTKEGFRE